MRILFELECIFMEISLKRDGLTLKGTYVKPDKERFPIAILFHGFMSSRRNEEDGLFTRITNSLVKNGVGVVKFDFDGHGESDGEFCDMNVYSEILDASKIIDYVRGLDEMDGIYIVGHSQGALVGGMTAGYYRECVRKLVMLAPAATIKEDALNGSCFGAPYDAVNVPDLFPVRNDKGEDFNVGGLYFRIARTLPIYETTSMFKGRTLIIHGTKDDVVRVSGSEKYKKCMEDCELVLLEGETHGLCDFSLDKVVDMTTRFLCGE